MVQRTCRWLLLLLSLCPGESADRDSLSAGADSPVLLHHVSSQQQSICLLLLMRHAKFCSNMHATSLLRLMRLFRHPFSACDCGPVSLHLRAAP